MVKLNKTLTGALIFCNLLSLSIAHPGEHHDLDHVREEVQKRSAHAAVIAKGLRNCHGKKSYERLARRSSARLAKKAEDLREEKGISSSLPYKTRRSLSQLEADEKINHNETAKGFTLKTKPKKLFASYKKESCILTPEVTQGPYWVTGEYIRRDLIESQKGVDIHLEFQFIDISTCDAAPGLMIDIWHANATGVYSGINARGNGNSADTSNLNATFLRGAQYTNKQGVAAFDTILPGHYAGRANHIHVIAHHDVAKNTNDTYSGGIISHVGQLFFQENLKSAYEATAPYNTNTQSETTNDEDMWAPQQASNNYDPFADYAYLGDVITDGLLMWISVGVNLTADYQVAAAATLTANGGVQNSNGGGGPPPPPS